MDLTNNFLNHRLSLQSNKPIMEKKRRARINHCLNELKTLILEAMKKDVSVPNLFLLLTQQPKAKKIAKYLAISIHLLLYFVVSARPSFEETTSPV